VAHRSSDKNTNKAIVRAFLGVAGIPISDCDIHDTDEPLPDILCTFADGARVAFELTEAVDQQMAQNVRVSPSSKTLMREYYKNLPPVDQNKLRAILADAHICVKVRNGTTDRRFEQLIPRVFDLLLGCSCGTKGNIEGATLPIGVEEIRITRGKWSTGPFLDRAGLALYVDDPTLKQAQAKFTKCYKCDVPIELVIYSKTCPLAPDELWKPGLHAFVAQNIARSPFCRVSVFDRIDSTIRYTYPER
jgi:hypothetical protein